MLREIPLPGHTVGPKQLEDLEGLQVQMVSEQVDLTLVRENKQSFLDVSVTFMMKNHGDTDVTMGVCYPIGPKNNMVSFEAETDGAIHKLELRKEAERDVSPGPYVLKLPVWFYDWEATFPAGHSCIHKVRYRVNLAGASRTGYTVSTGGPWKGKIEKSIVTLTGSAEAWSYVRAFGPAGAEESGERLVWRYHDYDPAPQHDIWINYKGLTLEAEVANARKLAHHWNQKLGLCTLLRHAHYSTGKLSHDQTQWRDYRAALHDLINEAKPIDDKVGMPRTEVQKVKLPPEG